MRYRSVLFAACLCTAFAPLSLMPGKWSSTGSVTMIDMPGMSAEALAAMRRRPITHSYCLTPQDVASGAKGMFSEGNGECRYTKFDMANGRLNAVMQCKGPGGDMRMTMLGTYSATGYETTNIMVMGGSQDKMRMASKMSGKRIGDC